MWSASALQGSRFMRGVAVGVSITLAALVGVTAIVWSRAVDERCETLPRADLSLQEMADIKLKVDASEREGSTPIEFSGREASFVVRDVLGLPIYIDVDGDEMVAQAAVQRASSCYNVYFKGRVAVSDGVVSIVPRELRVGAVDLSWWVARRAFGPGVLREAGADELISHVERLDVAEDRLTVKVDDVGALR